MHQLRKVCLLTLAFTLLVFAVCSASSSKIREFADPVTENMLIAINEDNYPAASQFFDEEMKNVLNEKEYQRQASKIKMDFGEYESKEFVCIKYQGQYTIVFYKAKFTEQDDVTVKTILSEDNEGLLISGFWVYK